MRTAVPQRLRSEQSGLRRSVFAGLLALAITTCQDSSAPRNWALPSDQAVVGPLVPSEGALLGAWVRPRYGWLKPEQKRALREFESAIGTRLAIVHHYVPAGRSVSWNPAWHLSRNQIPLITLGGLNSGEVLDGTHDRYLTSIGRSVSELGRPVFISYGAEMDGESNRAWVVSPSAYVSAWRHIHDLFDGTRTVWVWAPNASAFSRGVAPRYYPGDRYVDWIGADGYNWAACRGDPWEEFSEIFEGFYAWGSRTGKPLMVAETGTVEDPTYPLRKAEWLARAGNTIKTSMPALKAFVYFHSDRDCPWWLDSSQESLNAFRDLAFDPYFAPNP
jgi:beta-mannanase